MVAELGVNPMFIVLHEYHYETQKYAEAIFNIDHIASVSEFQHNLEGHPKLTTIQVYNEKHHVKESVEQVRKVLERVLRNRQSRSDES